MLTGEAPTGSVVSSAERPFAFWIAMIAAAGFVLRIAYVLGWQNPASLGGDAWYYHNAANLLADGHGFIHPFVFLHHGGEAVQAADHPPGYIAVLGLASFAGLRSTLDHQIVSALMGTATIVVVGATAAHVAGRRAGVLAGVIAAFAPTFWISDALVMSETFTILTASLVLLTSYRMWRHPTVWRVVAVGVAVGIFALARAEGLLLIPFLLLPLAILAPREEARSRSRLTLAAAGLCAVVLTVAPWVGYNESRFEHHVLITTNLGYTMVSANCDVVYSGALIGYWSYVCNPGPPVPGDLSAQDLAQRARARDYMSARLGRLPIVELARLGRTFAVFRPGQQLGLDESESGRPVGVGVVGLFTYYALAGAAIFGAIVMRRRGVSIFPALVLVGAVAYTTLLTFGQTRYRAAAEPAIALLAAVGIDAWLLAYRSRVSKSRSAS